MLYRLSSWLLMLGLVLLSGCQSANVKPNGDTSSGGGGNAIELRDKAYQAYNEGKWTEAEEALVALTQQIPQEPDPWFRLGNVYARQDEPRRAVAAYQEALVREPENGKAWHNMGIVQLRQAMHSFTQLQSATDPGDDLHERASLLIEAVSRVLENDFGADTETPVN